MSIKRRIGFKVGAALSGDETDNLIRSYRRTGSVLRFRRVGKKTVPWTPRPGFVYTQVRAISARVNQNYDAWPSVELKKYHRSFVGKPIFVNHGNEDPSRARGVVVAARYIEKDADKYVECVMETDAKRFPKLAHEIVTGGLDSVSMGVEAGFTICSVCSNRATDLFDMCKHIKFHKGEHLRNEKTGAKTLVYEKCYKLGFFELSYVFDPADETALVSRVISASNKQAGPPGSDWYHPSEHETLTTWSPKSEAYQDHPPVNTVVRLRNPEDTNIYDNGTPEEKNFLDPLGFMEPYTPSKQEYHVRERDRPENRMSRKVACTCCGHKNKECTCGPSCPSCDCNKKKVAYVDYFNRKEGRVKRRLYASPDDSIVQLPNTGDHWGGGAGASHDTFSLPAQDPGSQRNVEQTTLFPQFEAPKVASAGLPSSGYTPPTPTGDTSWHMPTVGVGSAAGVQGNSNGTITEPGGPTFTPASNVTYDPTPITSLGRRWYAYGEIEAPEDIDTLRDESEDDTDDFHHWVESPPELRAPNLDKAQQLDRDQEEDGLDGDRRAEDAEEFGAPGEQQFADEEQEDPNQPPMPINPPATRKGRRNREGVPMSRSYRYAAEDDEGYGDDDYGAEDTEDTGSDEGDSDFGGDEDGGSEDDIASLVEEAEQDLEAYENGGFEDDGSGDFDGDGDDDFSEEGDTDGDFGGDSGGDDFGGESGDEEDPGENQEASGDGPPWAQHDARRGPVSRGASGPNRRGTQGGSMTGSTLAQRARVAARGRQHMADDSGYTDGGPYGVDDSQGLQEDVFISQVPGAEAVCAPADDASNISNSPNNLVAWKQPTFDPNHYQRMADVVAALPPEQRRAVAEKMVREFKADNGRFNELTFYKAAKVRLVRKGNRLFFAEDLTDPDKVDPSLSGTDVQDLKGDDFEDLALDDVETQPKDASIHAFRAFDAWLQQATGKYARQHGNANYIRRAAASYVRATGRSLEGLFPTLEYVLREAKKVEKGADMRRRAENTSLETAAPDGRVDVEAPVKNVTDEKAQASQFDLGDFANNAGDNLADPVLDVVDGNAGTWAPDKGKESSVKLASGVEAVRCADAYIHAMPNTYKEADRWKLTARFETLRQPVVRERIRLLEAVVEDRKQAKTARKVTAASSRGTKGIPPGLGSGQRTAPVQKVAASDPDTDPMMFFG